MSFGNNLKKALDLIMERVNEHDEDWFIVIDGYERRGKTTLALQIAKYCKDNFGINDIIFSAREYEKRVHNSSKGDVILVDEGAKTFFSKDSITKEGKKMTQLFTVMGKYNTLTIICVPKIELLQKYIKEERIKTYIQVYKKGEYAVYNKPAAERYVKIKQRGYLKKKEKYPPFMFTEKFTRIDGEFWEEYKKKKDREIYDKKLFSDEEESITEKIYKCATCAKLWNLSTKTFVTKAQKFEIKIIKNDCGIPFITEKELQRFKVIYFNG